ncbi:flagellar biosynthesis protein FlhB [Alicyclobacillaceae bacterium I2511]|nr:flagellar biosynthesis protein FlhB [Alicyclobacillaceae bacterium I2511]
MDLLVFELQRFAGEKTERATPQRRRELRREGKLPRSMELTSALTLAALLVALRIFGPQVWVGWLNSLQQQLGNLGQMPDTLTGISGMLDGIVWKTFLTLAPLLAIGVFVGIASAFAQVGPVFLPNQVIPDWQRINPLSGIKRLWSLRGLADSVKSLLKLVAVAGVAYWSVKGDVPRLRTLGQGGVAAVIAQLAAMVFRIGLDLTAALLILAFLDFLFQRFDFERSIRMSIEEIRQEMKNQEGDPRVKSQFRQRGRALAMQRMMQEVPKADVVVTNPTHFAVALRYDAQQMAAPMVVAKGQDELAWRIRTLADKAGVPRVENRPLAQSLYRATDVGNQIPKELFHAVAEVLALVYQGRKGK